MRLIDLTVLLDPANREKLPPALQHAAGVVAPRIDYINPAEAAGKDEFCASLGCTHENLPDGEGWGSEHLHDFNSHCGTHVDAPLHSGTQCEGNPAGNPAVLRVREGGEVTDSIALDVHAYAVMLGGPEGRHLFICTSASHDPAEIAASPSGQICVTQVDVLGASGP